MRSRGLFRLATLVAVLGLWGCAAERAPEPLVTETPPPAAEKSAAQTLLESARVDLENGRVAGAKASLERALRIEPRNPALWQELARAHLREGNYQQAESLAARSNSWAGGNRALLAANWRLIAEARARRGDAVGAQAAFERERQFSE